MLSIHSRPNSLGTGKVTRSKPNDWLIVYAVKTLDTSTGDYQFYFYVNPAMSTPPMTEMNAADINPIDGKAYACVQVDDEDTG